MVGDINPNEAWHVVHGEGGASEAVLVSECYVDRDPYGEYIYYAACDAGALQDGKIAIDDYAFLTEVRVTFEEDLVEEGRGNLGWCRQDLDEQGDGFVREIWPSWQDVALKTVANSIFPAGQDYVMAKSVLQVGEDFASWLDVTRIEADQPAELALTFTRVEQDRMLEVKTVLKDANIPVCVVSEHWQTLVARFKDLPYEKLEGAERVELEIDEDFTDFDFDNIGDVQGEA